ncbi:hypothetical protein FL857_12260 [Criibacterium bergeronii]|uniref:Uncharacterized protein n=2 Tax=Criibacterium bergeronii TaxID=1871336 RepID=A0A552US16_9FIRM|nr:hypothetical protein FL857_12260 [Criibacterium bergeronii]
MEVSYSIKNAVKASKKDLIEALDIYTKTVDKFSETNTNEIMDYINKQYKENRIMFFYILYLNEEVCGFAEYGYLPKNKILLLDYLCTSERNHTIFFSFYHIIFEDIKANLKKRSLFIDFIITELSLKENDKKLIDVDSNYYRQVLSFEKFHILKIPYKQPYFNDDKITFSDFNLAIKKAGSYENNLYKFDRNFYIFLLEELYEEHYIKWYLHYMSEESKLNINEHFKSIIEFIKIEYPNETFSEEIYSVNCNVFDEGLCTQVNPEIITLTRERKIKRTKYFKFTLWLVITIISILLVHFQEIIGISKYIATLTTVIGLISGIFTFLPYLKKK